MKKLFLWTMALVLILGTTAFGAEEGDFKETTVRTEKGEIVFSAEGEIFKIGCRCIPEPEIRIHLPKNTEFSEEKLYFALRGNEKIVFDAPTDGQRRDMLCVELQDTDEDILQIKAEIFLERGVQKGDSVSLWLLGGKEWENNLLAEKKDILLREDFLTLDTYETPPRVPKEVILPIGADTITWNGEKKQLLAPIRRNADGQVMVAAKDLCMVMEGVSVPRNNILWDGDTKTVTLLIGARFITMTAGSTQWEYLGVEQTAKTAPEIVDGVLYLPLREMAEVFNFSTIQWDPSVQTVRLYQD